MISTPAIIAPHFLPFSQHVPLAVLTRGDQVESIHYGSIAVVDAQNKLVYSVGDSQGLTFTRSALKPIQAIPFLQGGGLAYFGWDSADLALMCASHSGEERHSQHVAQMLAKCACPVEALQCGIHTPFFYQALGKLPAIGETFNVLQHNCSGKHAGMLAYCRQHRLPLDAYLSWESPLQQAIQQAVLASCQVTEQQIAWGIDGCSAPNWAVPLSGLAFAYAQLASGSSPVYQQLFQAMTQYPELVSGERRPDLAFTQIAPGDWVVKGGAEAVCAVGIRSRGWGIAIKIADGGDRALYPILLALLRVLGVLEGIDTAALQRWDNPEMKNFRGLTTGQLLACLPE